MEKHAGKHWDGTGTGHYTHQDVMYREFMDNQIPNFKGGKILEIGPGTGKFAVQLIRDFDITEYKVLDLEENIMDSVNLIKEQTGMDVGQVYSQNYKDLFGEKFDLIVSNVCIPETPKNYREDLLNNVIPNTKFSMIIGQLTGKWVEGNEYEVWIKNLFNNNFSEVKCELTPYARCYALTGEK